MKTTPTTTTTRRRVFPLPRNLQRRQQLSTTAALITQQHSSTAQAQIAALQAKVAKLENSLAYYREKAAKPLREMDRTSWLRAALTGHATACGLPVIGTMHTTLYRAEICGSTPELRA